MSPIMRAMSLVVFGWLLSLGAQADEPKISAFLFGKYQDVPSVTQALTQNGFTVLSAEKVNKKGKLTTIVFTSDRLQKIAAKPQRGFGAVLRVLVNDIDHEISVTNPVYFEKAFLQSDYNPETVSTIAKRLRHTFPSLKEGKEKLPADTLASYHFMMGMPYYQDRIQVGQGEHNRLITALKNYKGGKRTLFVLKLNDHTHLAGLTLGNRTAKFIKKIGTRNAAVLPYTILIQDNAAYILDPKYYLALNYPTLKMSQFMTIATVPGAIEKECARVFK
jgi:hypothetical protein